MLSTAFTVTTGDSRKEKNGTRTNVNFRMYPTAGILLSNHISPFYL